MRELVLTGHQNTWPVDEHKALFLGPHCFCYNRKYDFLDQDKFELAPSPWKNARDMLEASLYIDELYDRIILRLSGIMNSLHGVTYSEKFWRVCIGLWLHQWLGITYDRYRRLEHCREVFREKFIVMIPEKYDPAVNNLRNFIVKITEGHYQNLLVMSEIINHAQFDFLEAKKISVAPEEDTGFRLAEPKDRIRDLFFSFQEAIREHFNDFISSSLHFGTVYGLSLADRLYLQFCRDPMFLFKKKARGSLRPAFVDKNMLDDTRLELKARNGFERVVENILLGHIPEAFLTVYKFNGSIGTRIKAWVGTDIYVSQKKCFDIAFALENGGRWISVQHGGVYGQSLSFPLGKHEYETSGEFITWGWDHRHVYEANYHVLSSPLLSRLKRNSPKEDTIIFVGGTMIAYLYRMNNYLLPEQISEYLKNKVRFLGRLDAAILRRIKYRPYFYDYGIGEIRSLGDLLGREQFITRGKLTEYFLRAKLAVIDHPSTGFLQAFTMNIPTLLYWQPEHFVHCDAAVEYFDRLRSAGVLFDTPQAAAEKINQVWPDISGWWNQSDVQLAKNDFCFRFSRASRKWRREWVEFVKKI